MSFDDEKSSIERLNKVLYSRNISSERKKRRMTEVNYDVEENWNEADKREFGDEVTETTPRKRFSNFTFAQKILFGSLLFFVIAVLVSVFIVFGGGNLISTRNVDISVLGPVSIGGGEELSLDVTVSNNNNVSLELVDLVAKFPDGTKQAGDLVREMKTYRQSLGTISSGSSSKRTIRAVLFGEENSKKTINISVEYRVSGSNAIFSKEKDYEITISSSPVRVIVSSLKEVTSNQQMELQVEISSNSTLTLNDVLIKAEYPFGFSFKNASVNPVLGNSVWKIGDLEPDSKRIIKIRGSLEGQDGEERTFRFTVGKEDPEEANQLGVAFLSSNQTVAIKKPFLDVALSLDGDSTSKEVIAKTGRTIRGDLIWGNNLQASISNVVIEVKFSGQTLDKSSVTVDRGFYNSSNNTITWDKTNYPGFQNIQSGENGRFSFSFASNQNISSVSNPQITLDVSVRGDRLSEDNSIESLSSFVTKNVKVASNLRLVAKASHFQSVIPNRGPMPPKAEQETTYTVTWTVTNSVNDISNAKVVTTLPSYVKFDGLYNPSTEEISYDNVSGELVWSLGNVPAGTGFTRASREVVFQVTLLPSVTQVGTSPILINESVLSGYDSFANALVKDTKQNLGIRLTGDTGYTDDMGVVAK